MRSYRREKKIINLYAIIISCAFFCGVSIFRSLRRQKRKMILNPKKSFSFSFLAVKNFPSQLFISFSDFPTNADKKNFNPLYRTFRIVERAIGRERRLAAEQEGISKVEPRKFSSHFKAEFFSSFGFWLFRLNE